MAGTQPIRARSGIVTDARYTGSVDNRFSSEATSYIIALIGTGLALLVSVFLIAGCGASTPAQASGKTKTESKHVVILSIDGMVPATYLEPDAHGLRVPHLRTFATQGAFASGVRSVFPSVTYPAHTTIATGKAPALHGITTNRAFDPTDKNLGGWRWYAEDIAVPTLWERAKKDGRSVATINWPVTVGARHDFNVPEYWRAGTADDVKLARALTHPAGLLESVAAKHPEFSRAFTPPDIRDSATGDIAEYLIVNHRPELLLAHMWWVDEMQHQRGLWSAEAKAAIEIADAQIGRLIQATKEAGVYDETVFVIVSDHGFAAIKREVRVGAVLRNAGFITTDDDGTITDWRASASTDGGLSLVYVKDNDPQAIAAVTSLFAERAKRPDESGIGRVFSSTELAERGADPKAALAIEAADGFAFTGGVTGGELIASGSAATHGYDPARNDMRASLLIWGKSIESEALGEVSLLDVAPTVARLLGLKPQGSPGKDLLGGNG